VRCSKPESKYRGAKASPVWDDGILYASEVNPGLVRAWKCLICKEVVLLAYGKTSNASKHMTRKHGRQYLDEDTTSSSLNDNSSQLAEREGERLQQPQASQSLKPPPVVAQMLFRPKVKEFRRSLLKWMIKSHTPFYTVDDEDFREIIACCNTQMTAYLPGRDALRSWTKQEFVVAKNKIKEMLKATQSKIHVSFDIWTSDYSSYAFLGVVAHFV